MNTEQSFEMVARHSAAQFLFGECYVENLRVAAAVLAGSKPECSCMRSGVSQFLIENHLFAEDEVQRFASHCQACRNALNEAASAWESGDTRALQSRLRDYRAAHAQVRTNILEMITR